ncbi:MAG TPA: glycosyltransferase family 2 protein [Pirellulaceae bacterium]
MCDISIIVPIYNERENIEVLHREITNALAGTPRPYELVLVDDGSRDGSREELERLARQDERVRLVLLRRNFGQTAALQAGIDLAEGEILVMLDGDLQNDPADIPALLQKIDDGYDLACGWRRNRQDKWLTRRLPSRIANRLIAWVTGVSIRDLGCTLKAIRRELAEELELVGDMHRFIPILAHRRGALYAEVETHHRPRRYGESKYGLSRIVRVVLDLITVKFLLDYFTSPIKFFGQLGLGCGALGGMAAATTLGMKLIAGVDMTGNPLLLVSIFFLLAGLQLTSLGVLGEINIRIYYDRHHRKPYAVTKLVGFEGRTQRHTLPLAG